MKKILALILALVMIMSLAACGSSDTPASTPDEPAKLFAFLAGPKARYISGATITIDGGWYTTHSRV